jgi:hypothetical protein
MDRLFLKLVSAQFPYCAVAAAALVTSIEMTRLDMGVASAEILTVVLVLSS